MNRETVLREGRRAGLREALKVAHRAVKSAPEREPQNPVALAAYRLGAIEAALEIEEEIARRYRATGEGKRRGS